MQAEEGRRAKALTTLSPHEQRVLDLRLYQRKRWSEIRAICSFSESELRRRYGITLRKMRVLLTETPPLSGTAKPETLPDSALSHPRHTSAP